MKIFLKISAMTFWTFMFLLTPAAMAVVIGGGQILVPFSEPAAMVLLGMNLVCSAGFWRKKMLRKKH